MGREFELLRSTGKYGEKRNVSSPFRRFQPLTIIGDANELWDSTGNAHSIFVWRIAA